jgi:hypothetical protein
MQVRRDGNGADPNVHWPVMLCGGCVVTVRAAVILLIVSCEDMHDG